MRGERVAHPQAEAEATDSDSWLEGAKRLLSRRDMSIEPQPTLSEVLCWSLFAPGDVVLAAVSGGPDSLSLLHALHAGGAAHGITRLEAAHLDHGLRGDESAGEAGWVTDWCARRGIPCYVGRADVAARAAQGKIGKPQAAREARLEFLEETAARVGASKIATGHNRDDQAETVLLHVLRGAGAHGLAGIPARRGLYVRPLLDVSRAEVEAYCAAHGLDPRRDPSNLSPHASLRNRVRLDLLPRLVREYNADVSEALWRLAGIAARDADYLEQQAAGELGRLTRAAHAAEIVLDRAALADTHPALQRHVLRLAIVRLRGTAAGMSYAHLEQVCAAAAGARAFGLTLPRPSCLVRVTEDGVTLTVPGEEAPPAEFCVPLPVPGVAVLPYFGMTVRASLAEIAGAVALDADRVETGTLTVRGWRPGDRIAPTGMGGRHKKLQDIFTDAKTPRALRGSVPLVEDANGLVWVAGHCLVERVRVTPSTRRRLFLQVEGAPWLNRGGERREEGE